MFKRVSEVPVTGQRSSKESYVARDVREFCRNTTYGAAEVLVEGKKAANVAAMLRRYIKQHPKQCEGVRVCLRGERVYLEREVRR